MGVQVVSSACQWVRSLSFSPKRLRVIDSGATCNLPIFHPDGASIFWGGLYRCANQTSYKTAAMESLSKFAMTLGDKTQYTPCPIQPCPLLLASRINLFYNLDTVTQCPPSW